MRTCVAVLWSTRAVRVVTTTAVEMVLLSEQFYLPWIADRFAGKPAADGCAAS